MEPLISVIIPTLNEESQMAGCLEQLSSEPRAEVVVSDGGSEDNTAPIARSTSGVKVVNGGPGRGQQLNRGALEATCERFLFLHVDCRLPAGWFDALYGALEDQDTALVCFRLHTVPTSPCHSGRLRRAWLRGLDIRSYGFGLPYGDQGFGVRRTTFEAAGGFPNIPLMEDLAFAKSCRQLGGIKRLEQEMITTARRFERRPVRSRVMTATFPLLFRLGVSPHRLAKWYGTVR